MSTPRATRWALGLILPLALTANACAAGDADDEAVIEVQTSAPAGQATGAVVTDENGQDTTDDGSADGTSEGGAEATGSATGQAAGGGGGDGVRLNAKTLAAVTIDDLSPADDPVGGADEQAMAFDQPNQGDIESPFGADRWTFDGSDGQLLGIEVLDIGSDCNQDLTLNLESPSGKRGEVTWVGNGGCEAHGPLLLDETGPWALEFVGGDGAVISDTTGGYRFVPVWLTEFDSAPAVFDQPNDGGISQVFGVDQWTFEGTAGEQISIEVLSIGDDCNQDLTLALIDPFEERTELTWVGNGGCEVHGPFQLERDGTYAIEFSGGDGAVIQDTTGAYQFVPRLVG